MKLLLGQLKGAFNITVMCANTVFWVFPLYLVTTLKLVVPFLKFKSLCNKILLKISEYWISGNTFVLNATQKIHWDIRGLHGLSNLKSYLIIANHQSWVDIVVLQKVFNQRIPFLRFFVKKQLKWLPLLGGAFWALDFPFMNRFSKAYLKKHPEKAGEDMKATQDVCRKVSKGKFSLINFPEGTRFTWGKHKKQKSPFQNQLKPKAGGIAYAIEAFEGKLHNLLDVTIVYPDADLSFWGLLSGKVPRIIVYIKQIKIPKEFNQKKYATDKKYRKQVQTWINDIWQQKDQIIESTLTIPATN